MTQSRPSINSVTSNRSSIVSDIPQAKEICEHYWAWISPAVTNNSARLCMLCHEPDAEWLNTIVEVQSKEGKDMCDCESRHVGYACNGMSCRCHDAKEVIRVPIKFDGFVIGKAEISPDGRIINAELDNSSVGQEIRNVLLCGLADGISIRPNFIPAKRKDL